MIKKEYTERELEIIEILSKHINNITDELIKDIDKYIEFNYC